MRNKNKRKDKKRIKKELTKKLINELGIDTKKIRIQLIELNNKGRKGKYVYIKIPKGKARYYKQKEGVSLDNYLRAFEGELKVKKDGVVDYKGKRPSEIYVNKIKSRPRIDSLIEKGISDKGEIGNLYNSDRSIIRNAYKNMLRPLVKDERLLDILAMEENVEKFKYRIQTKITLSDDDNKIKVSLISYGKSIDNIYTDLGKILDKKNLYNEDLKRLKERGYNISELVGTDIKSTYENEVVIKKVNRIKLNLRYVKGR